jgi:hypothetical protein
MELLGFGWTEILAALGASAAALIALHLVRLRRRVVEVPSLAFFAEALPDERSHRSFARLRNLLLLVLMLLAAAAMALGMGLPEFIQAAGERHDVVLLMDATASMQTRTGGLSAFEQARRDALRTIESLPTDSRILLMRLSHAPEVVLPWTQDRNALREAIEAMQPSESASEPERALAWASSTCNQAVACRILFFTDHASGVSDLEGVEVHLAGQDEAPENAAISAFSARRFPADPTRAEVLVDIANYGASRYEGTLTLTADEVVLHREPLRLTPGEHATRSFDRITGADARLTAHIEAPAGDALALDDTAYAQIPPRRRRQLTLVGSGHAYLDAALLLDTFLAVRTMEPEAFEAARLSSPELFAADDVWLFDGYTPREAPSVPSLLLHPASAAWLEVGEVISRPRFEEQERTHPVLRYIALGDVNIAEARPIVPRASLDEVLAGEPRGALLVRGVRDEVPFIALAFDVRASDFALRIGWPVFLMQSIAYLSPDDVRVTEGAHTGDAITLPWDATDAPSLTLRTRSESVSVLGLQRGEEALFTLARGGAYQAPNGQWVVANLFSPSESALARSAPQAAPEQASEPPQHATLGLHDVSLTSVLIALAFAVLALEWLLFHRRTA